MKVSGGGKAKWQYNLVTFAYMKFDYRKYMDVDYQITKHRKKLNVRRQKIKIVTLKIISKFDHLGALNKKCVLMNYSWYSFIDKNTSKKQRNTK